MFKVISLLALVAAAQAAVTYGNGHIGAQSESTVRGLGGLSTVSHQSKVVNSPYSTSSKSDTRVTNAGLYAAAPVAYAQPAYAHAAPVAYAQPQVAYAAQAAPVAYAHGPSVTYTAGPAVAKVAAPVAYAQPAYAHAAPVAYAQPAYAHAAPVAYAAPAVAKVAAPLSYAAPVAKAVAAPGLLGVAYSAVQPGVATLSFDGFGVHYGY